MTADKILIDRSVVEQALEALDAAMSGGKYPYKHRCSEAINTLREILEQPQVEQEPVGFVRQIDIEQIAKTPSDWGAMFGKVMGFNTVPVYTHPQPQVEQEPVELRHLRALNQELLEALEKISAIENQEYGADWEEIEEARDIADAAIAKATGETK